MSVSDFDFELSQAEIDILEGYDMLELERDLMEAEMIAKMEDEYSEMEIWDSM